MTPPVFLAVAALGLAAPLMAQTPVHSMPRETRASLTCLAIDDEVEDAIRADRNVLVFSDLNLLAPGEHFRAVRTEAIEGLDRPLPDQEKREEPLPENHSSPLPGGVVTVGRSVPASPAATPVPEPSSAFLAALAAAGLIRRRRV